MPSLISSDDQRRAWMVLGSGGVGKTTLSAALALVFAERGLDTAVVTLDPSRRLADALAISRSVDAEQPVPLERIERHFGVQFTGRLMGGVLDTKSMFDRMVRGLLAGDGATPSAPGRAERLLENRYYQKLSTSLAGAEHFMSLAKLDELLSARPEPAEATTDGAKATEVPGSAYDRVVFDTPPAFHTLDFLSMPERLTGFLDFPGVRSALQLMDGPRPGWAPLLQMGRVTLRGLERFLGREFLTELFAFLGLFAEVLEEFSAQAKRIQPLLLGQEVGYLLVLAPSERSINEGEHVMRRFADEGRVIERVVFNRVHPARFSRGRLDEVRGCLSDWVATSPAAQLSAASIQESFLRRVPELLEEHEALAGREQRLIEGFQRRHSGREVVAQVAELPTDVDSLETLYRYSRLLPMDRS